MDNGNNPVDNTTGNNMNENPRRATPARLIFLVFFVVVLGVFWYSAKHNQTGEENNLVGEQGDENTIGANLAWTDGVVEYKSDGVWKRAEGEVKLNSGDSVEVIGSGRAIIVLDDGSIIRLNKNSAVTLTDLNPENVIISNDKGEAYTRVALADRDFSVKIGEVTCQSLGTAYKTVNAEKKKGVEVYQSKVKVLGVTDKEILVDEGNAYYLLNADDKSVEKKIAKLDQDALTKDTFITWNKEEDLKIEEYKEELGVLEPEEVKDETPTEVKKETPTDVTPPATTASGLRLTGKKTDDGVYLSWTLSGMEAPMGFKLVKSLSPNPVYPGDNFVYLEMANTRNYTWKITDGRTYYFRVCRYLGGQCGEYSNNISVTAPKLTYDQSTVKAITLSGQGSSVNWTVEGSSEKGFKVVWSRNQAPTYPCREGDQYVYYSSPDQTSGTIKSFDGPGKYYVRVCEYLGGECGVYSNEITVNF